MTGFYREDAGRVSRATLWVERHMRGQRPRRGRWFNRPGSKVIYAGLSAQLDGDEPATSVSAQRVTLNVEANGGKGVWEDTDDDPIEVFPGFLLGPGKTLASGTRVAIVKFEGRWSVLGAACD